MIIQCENCASKYFLPESKVPPEPTRVRCPQCRAVFTLVPETERVGAVTDDRAMSSPMESAEGTTAADPHADFAMPTEGAATSPKSPKESPEDKRAKRLARVLVSDILCYNQDKRDQALVDGTLVSVLGDEVKKSWELYKEKVGSEIADSTDYFKEALNEILADGQKVF